MVIATQNPVELQGTFPLPEAQLDRFLMQLPVGYPSAPDEAEILRRFRTHNPLDDLNAVTGPDDLVRLSVGIEHIDDLLEDLDQALDS